MFKVCGNQKENLLSRGLELLTMKFFFFIINRSKKGQFCFTSGDFKRRRKVAGILRKRKKWMPENNSPGHGLENIEGFYGY